MIFFELLETPESLTATARRKTEPRLDKCEDWAISSQAPIARESMEKVQRLTRIRGVGSKWNRSGEYPTR